MCWRRCWPPTNGVRLVDIRDRALLLTTFASAGRRSEVAEPHIEHLVDEEPVHADSLNTASPLLPCLTINLGPHQHTPASRRWLLMVIKLHCREA